MSDLYLVRHAQASHGAENYDKLSPLGFDQSHWLAEHFALSGVEFGSVWSGTHVRHIETLQVLAQTINLPVATETSALNEYPYDCLKTAFLASEKGSEPISRQDFLSFLPKLFHAWDKGQLGNDVVLFQRFQAEAHRFFKAIKPSEKPVLVVSSGGLIAIFIESLLGFSAKATAELSLEIHNSSIHKFTRHDGEWHLSTFNETPHMDAPVRQKARTFI